MAQKIIGLDRLNRKLSALPIAAQTAVRKAMREAAESIIDMMKNLVPVGDGDLRDSIDWTWGKAPKGTMTLGKVRSTGSENTITIFAGNSKAWYARLVEFGTSPHINGGKFAGTEHPGTKAQPYFYVSYRANRRRAKSKVTRAINKAAKTVAAGGK
jgi:HK97 gp10 family phage protein